MNVDNIVVLHNSPKKVYPSVSEVEKIKCTSASLTQDDQNDNVFDASLKKKCNS